MTLKIKMIKIVQNCFHRTLKDTKKDTKTLKTLQKCKLCSVLLY